MIAMQADSLQDILRDVRTLRGRFAATAPRAWDAATGGAELTVQLGHLALCLLRRRATDVTELEDADRPIINIGDELADIVLSGLSITVLAEAEPTAGTVIDRLTGDEIDAFLRLLVICGWLAEAGLVDQGYRHRPAGAPASVAEAGSAMVTACETLAVRLDLDLRAEFQVMVADADQFLTARGA